MEEFGCLTVLIVIVIAVITVSQRGRRSADIIEGWASENKFTVLEQAPRGVMQGPLLWAGKNQTVYRITVKDRQGRRRSGWVRCGGFWTGLNSDKVAVIWDD